MHVRLLRIYTVTRAAGRLWQKNKNDILLVRTWKVELTKQCSKCLCCDGVPEGSGDLEKAALNEGAIKYFRMLLDWSAERLRNSACRFQKFRYYFLFIIE